MADQDDRTFCVPDCPLGRGNIVIQRVEWVLDCNNLESGLFEIRDDLLPARPVRERTMDKDRGLGFQLGSRSWRADRNHRGQQEAQAHNAFVRFHSYVPSFGGDLGVAIFTVDTNHRTLRAAAQTVVPYSSSMRTVLMLQNSRMPNSDTSRP